LKWRDALHFLCAVVNHEFRVPSVAVG
jgi:hypothetical protein